MVLPVGLRHMMTGVPDPWLSTLRAGLKAEDDTEGWLTWETGESGEMINRKETHRAVHLIKSLLWGKVKGE